MASEVVSIASSAASMALEDARAEVIKLRMKFMDSVNHTCTVGPKILKYKAP
jgi:hypothetical protein